MLQSEVGDRSAYFDQEKGSVHGRVQQGGGNVLERQH